MLDAIQEIQTSSSGVRFTGYVIFTIGTIIGSTRATYELCTPTVCVARLRTSPNLKDLSELYEFRFAKSGCKSEQAARDTRAKWSVQCTRMIHGTGCVRRSVMSGILTFDHQLMLGYHFPYGYFATTLTTGRDSVST